MHSIGVGRSSKSDCNLTWDRTVVTYARMRWVVWCGLKSRQMDVNGFLWGRLTNTCRSGTMHDS